MVGRQVEVYIHYDIPEIIHIVHPDSGELLKVERVLTKRRTATPVEIAKSSAARRAHIAGARGESGNIDNLITSWVIRESEYSEADKEKGRTIKKDIAEHKAQGSRDASPVLLGDEVPSNIPNPQRFLECQEREIGLIGLRQDEVKHD